MNKHPNSLSIRVRMADEDEPQNPAAQEEVIVLWDRIIAAVLLLALLGGLLFMALQYWRSAAPQQPAVLASTEKDPVTAEPLQSVADDADESLSTTTPPSFQDPLTVAEPTVTDASDLKLKPVLTSAPSTEEVVTEESNQPTVGNVAADVTTSSDAVVSVHSERIRQAQLTTEMKNRVPQNHAPAELVVIADELQTVYFAVDIAGYRATPVFFNWYRDDRRVARVRVRPKGDLTSTYSSKFIDQYMGGDWRVDLTSEAGETLATARFRVLVDQG